MTATLDDTVAPAQPDAVAPRRGRLRGGRMLHIYTWLVIAWLILPIAVMIAFGFNDTKGRFNQTWDGFTLKWYGRVFDLDELPRRW
jgi:spermidine/putrescine transport system permease protein